MCGERPNWDCEKAEGDWVKIGLDMNEDVSLSTGYFPEMHRKSTKWKYLATDCWGRHDAFVKWDRTRSRADDKFAGLTGSC
ncbi:hypothetical protein KS4_21280 [Poriferisphaera corsica]|uniref:Uncharacterized protein n=1 Tax=Poriferisphaera corsica TaxID=2528020 RepID=A0A517YV20_9BACT|nr:hypothetical protein KS4_21280 [Poriferisphaera corsica]